MIGSSNRKESKSPLAIILILSIVTGSVAFGRITVLMLSQIEPGLTGVFGRWAVYLLHAIGSH